MTFLVDAQLPPSLAAALREAGYDAVAVKEVGLRDSDDSAIWQYALQHDMAIVTKDEDFAERSSVSQLSPIVVWLRLGNATNPLLLAWFMPMVPAILTRVRSGDRLIELR